MNARLKFLPTQLPSTYITSSGIPIATTLPPVFPNPDLSGPPSGPRSITQSAALSACPDYRGAGSMLNPPSCEQP